MFDQSLLLFPVKMRCGLLALEYKSGVYVTWNSQTFPSETLDSVFSYQRKVCELRQTLDVNKILKGTGEELSDVSIIRQDSTVSNNSRTLISRVRVGGLLFAQKTFKSSDPNWENIYLREVGILKQLTRNPHWHVILLLRHYADLEGQACLLLSP